MPKSKFDIFNLLTGNFEEEDVDPEEFVKSITKALVKESAKLTSLYEAEKEIVSNILDKASIIEDNKDRSTD
tara:strand:- start:1600 stop:1815 length:216 start_codon:yes stop_codon:yes gene_type:complete